MEKMFKEVEILKTVKDVITIIENMNIKEKTFNINENNTVKISKFLVDVYEFDFKEKEIKMFLRTNEKGPIVFISSNESNEVLFECGKDYTQGQNLYYIKTVGTTNATYEAASSLFKNIIETVIEVFEKSDSEETTVDYLKKLMF